MVSRAWRFAASVRVTLWLLALTAVTLFLGSFSVKANPRLYSPLNYMLLQDWLRQHTGSGFATMGWFLLAAGLLFLLGLNTAACVLDRVLVHWSRRKSTGSQVFVTRLLPSLVHACFGIILLGHLASLTFGYRSTAPLRTETAISLPQGASVVAGARRLTYYPPPFTTSLRECVVPLTLRAGGRSETATIGLGRPVFWHGLKMHLLQAGGAAAGAPPNLQLIVRQDPGLDVILRCFPILLALMLAYYYLAARAPGKAEANGGNGEAEGEASTEPKALEHASS